MNDSFKYWKRKVEDERAEANAGRQLVKKKTSFHRKPSVFDQLLIPMNCFNLVTQNYLFQPSFKWTIGGINTIATQKTIELNSEMFQWNGYPVQARAKLQLKEDDYIYMSLCLSSALKEGIEMKDFAPFPQVFYLLKDKITRNHACEAALYQSGSALTRSFAFDLNFVHKSWLNHCRHNIKNSVEIEIYVEPSPMVQHVLSYNGTLNWVVENYSRKLQLERENLALYEESAYFYTSPRGYRVQVRLYLNDDEGGGGPAAQILFLTGKLDAELPTSFFHSTTVTLINRKNPARSIGKTVVADIVDEKDYEFEICKFEEVENVIENDTLFCKVVIRAQ